jgi:hypothetical protein
VERLSNLAEIARALDPPRRLSGGLNCRQEQGHEKRHNGCGNEQFDCGEARSRIHFISVHPKFSGARSSARSTTESEQSNPGDKEQLAAEAHGREGSIDMTRLGAGSNNYT